MSQYDERNCAFSRCRTLFTPTRNNQVFCCPNCQDKARYYRNTGREPKHNPPRKVCRICGAREGLVKDATLRGGVDSICRECQAGQARLRYRETGGRITYQDRLKHAEACARWRERRKVDMA